ncbi:MAG: thioredoxin family protein [Patescibacteria group bacterium]|nr:thioredoxin family protein [Patescibacteria group bacterium]
MNLQTLLAAAGGAIILVLVSVGLIVVGTSGTDSSKNYVEVPSYIKEHGIPEPQGIEGEEASKTNLTLSEESGITKNEDIVRDMGGVKLSEDGIVLSTRHYIPYTEDALIRASSGGGKAVLFFTRSDCETCTDADRRLTAADDTIRPRVTVLKVDMTDKSDITKLYGVERPHTFLQVDNNGKEVTRWVGGDIDTLNEKVVMY